MSMIKLLANRQFRNFFLADIISGFGVGLTTVGANWYMLAQTHSNGMVGMYLTVNVVVGFIMAPIAGYLTDRWSRRTVILWSFLGRALPMVLIAVVFATSGFNVWVMYALAALTGAGWITYMSASRSYIQAILPTDLLGVANSFVEVSLQVGMFVAGAASGIILNFTGFLTILVINIIMFLFGTWLIWRSPHDHVSRGETLPVNTGFVAGLRYVLARPIVLLVGVLSVLPLLVTQLFNVSSPAYVADVLQQSSVVYGTADMLYGVGGLTAGLITARIISRYDQRWMIIAYFALASLALITLYWGRAALLMYLCTYGIGLANSSLRIVTNTVLMERVERQYMGRATSIWNGTAQFLEIFASSWIGIMNDRLGSNFGFLVMFVIMVAGIVISVVARRVG